MSSVSFTSPASEVIGNIGEPLDLGEGSHPTEERDMNAGDELGMGHTGHHRGFGLTR